MTPRDVEFAVVRGKLVRRVRLGSRPPYRHRCDRETLAAVAHAFAERPDGATTRMLWAALPGTSRTRIGVALDFLKERGCVVSRGRRSYAASDFVVEDALIEFHALGPG